MIPTAQRKAATVAIMRFGTQADLLKPGGTQTDAYGKVTETSWESAGSERVVRIYQRGSSPEQIEVIGGRYRTDNPLLLFRHDTAIEDGFRVEFPDVTYEIDTHVRYPSHVEAETSVAE